MRELGARRIERGGEDDRRGRRRRPARLCSARLEDKGGGGGGENVHGFVGDKDGRVSTMGEVRRCDAWRAPTSRSTGNWQNRGGIVTELNSFEMTMSKV